MRICKLAGSLETSIEEKHKQVQGYENTKSDTLRESRGWIKIGSFGEINLKHEQMDDLGGLGVNYLLPSFIYSKNIH